MKERDHFWIVTGGAIVAFLLCPNQIDHFKMHCSFVLLIQGFRLHIPRRMQSEGSDRRAGKGFILTIPFQTWSKVARTGGDCLGAYSRYE